MYVLVVSLFFCCGSSFGVGGVCICWFVELGGGDDVLDDGVVDGEFVLGG